MRKRLIFGVVWWACGWVGPAAAAEDAASILRASEAAYAKLQTYQDVGVVRTTVGGDVSFDTAFVRPWRFRFAWTAGHPFILLRCMGITGIVRADGPRVTMWRKVFGDEPTEKVEPSLAVAVAGATGVSMGSAHTIATLLMPHLWDEEPFGASVLALSSPRLLDDQPIDRTPCRHLAGLSSRGDPMELWIGTEDHLLRRFDVTLGDFSFSEIHRELRVDAPVAAATFAALDVRR